MTSEDGREYILEESKKPNAEPIWVTQRELIIQESLSIIHEVTEGDDRSILTTKRRNEGSSHKMGSKFNPKNWFKSTASSSVTDKRSSVLA